MLPLRFRVINLNAFEAHDSPVSIYQVTIQEVNTELVAPSNTTKKAEAAFMFTLNVSETAFHLMNIGDYFDLTLAPRLSEGSGPPVMSGQGMTKPRGY
ncbi:hypothetical protein [Myxococcus phage Mx1]|nr:hypothetical protein [Myxococcus phage Mx1]